MSETVRLYDCGCYDGEEAFEPCRKAQRLEDRMHDAELEVQSYNSNGPMLAESPLTYDDAEYFERANTLKDHADKLARVAAVLEDLSQREIRVRRRANRAHRAISHHISVQMECGAYKDVVLEDPPEPDYDEADLY